MDASTPSADDLNMAETLWIMEAQKEFVRDIHFSQWKKQFNLFQDDDKLWRCRGRIQNANISSTKNPILLPRAHFLVYCLPESSRESHAWRNQGYFD